MREFRPLNSRERRRRVGRVSLKQMVGKRALRSKLCVRHTRHRPKLCHPLEGVQGGIRQLQPFGCHFAVDRANVLILCNGHHIQAMRRVTHIFFVPVILRNYHNSSP